MRVEEAAAAAAEAAEAAAEAAEAAGAAEAAEAAGAAEKEELLGPKGGKKQTVRRGDLDAMRLRKDELRKQVRCNPALQPCATCPAARCALAATLL